MVWNLWWLASCKLFFIFVVNIFPFLLEGRGIFINDRRDEFGIFIVWVGEEDQMRIMAMNKGSDCIAIWNLFYAGLQAVHEGVQKRKIFFVLYFFLLIISYFCTWEGHDFAFMESHGYLATCPTNLGTGMRASVHVNLPGFKTKQEVKDYVKTTGNVFCWNFLSLNVTICSLFSTKCFTKLSR